MPMQMGGGEMLEYVTTVSKQKGTARKAAECSWENIHWHF